MVELSRILVRNITSVRTDFYEVKGKLYFGELIFYPVFEMESFSPGYWDDMVGSWLII
jgi:hypothetical protein